jgi:hypothetical protein
MVEDVVDLTVAAPLEDLPVEEICYAGPEEPNLLISGSLASNVQIVRGESFSITVWTRFPQNLTLSSQGVWFDGTVSDGSIIHVVLPPDDRVETIYLKFSKHVQITGCKLDRLNTYCVSHVELDSCTVDVTDITFGGLTASNTCQLPEVSLGSLGREESFRVVSFARMVSCAISIKNGSITLHPREDSGKEGDGRPLVHIAAGAASVRAKHLGKDSRVSTTSGSVMLHSPGEGCQVQTTSGNVTVIYPAERVVVETISGSLDGRGKEMVPLITQRGLHQYKKLYV